MADGYEGAVAHFGMRTDGRRGGRWRWSGAMARGGGRKPRLIRAGPKTVRGRRRTFIPRVHACNAYYAYDACDACNAYYAYDARDACTSYNGYDACHALYAYNQGDVSSCYESWVSTGLGLGCLLYDLGRHR